MIRQTILPFKVEMTRDLTIFHVALLGEFAVGLRVLKSVDSYGSGAGYKQSEYILPSS